jgi:hypothetical protein
MVRSAPCQRCAPFWSAGHGSAQRPTPSVDATSFAVMRSLRLRGAPAFDGDFRAAGLNELRIASDLP